jgi:PAS domain S-box-containing protein
LRVDLYTTLGQSSRAIAVGLDYLRHLGIDWSPHPTEEEARREYERIWSQLGSRTIEALIDLPLMSDLASLATMDVLTKLSPSAIQTDANLFSLVTCRAINLSVERGNCDASCVACVRLGMVAGPRFGDYQPAYRFGRLGYDLVERHGLKRFEARTRMSFGCFVLPWTRHVRSGRDFLRQALHIANQMGDHVYVAYSGDHLTTNLLAAGDPLDDAQREAENGIAFARKARFGPVVDRMSAQLGLIQTLRGLTPTFGSFDNGQFDELEIEHRFVSNPDLAHAECWYWIRKLQARFFAGQYAAAVKASSRAQSRLWTTPSHFETAEYHFYGALSRAAYCDSVPSAERQKHLEALAVHYEQLQVWAANCPDNFENRVALVGAEIARLNGRDFDGMRLYEQAIHSAQANGFIQNEALANELASRFYSAQGFEKIARAYLQDARYCYLRWGADGKVRQLEQLHPHLRETPAPTPSTATIGRPVEQLDVGTVLKAAQAVSGEIELGDLIKVLLRIAVEHAGAERGLLILFADDEPRIAAEAKIGSGRTEVTLRQTSVSPAEFAELVLRFVIRTRESVIIDDALVQNPFSADDYICQKRARSVLCLPLVKQAKLIGALYLENNLASHVFTPARIAVLDVLASQAAISLENAKLYNDLREREARIRRLVDSNIVGIVIWDVRGWIIEANQAFLDIVGYGREDLVSGRLRWTELTPAEWRDADEQIIAELKAVGTLEPREKEYLRKDGRRVPVLVARAMFEWNEDEGVAFVLDLTERKRVEGALRDAQANLAHVARVTTLGELAASIAHEVNQPLAGVIANAAACLRWLDRGTPDLNAARRSVEWVIDDGNRASEVIRRVHALAKKTDLEKVLLDINDVVREVVALVQREVTSQQVSLRMELAPTLSMTSGDRVQLQQVMINLIINGVEAMKMTDRPRELVIRSRQDETQQVLVSVADCGVGIPAENADRLFTPFFTTKSSGMGMGLSICRSIIEAHGGRLWATANVPFGAMFQFTLPSRC